MTAIEHIEQQVQQLSAQEFAKFRDWFHDYEWQAWDRQIAKDATAGKLDALANKARADHAAGRTSRI